MMVTNRLSTSPNSRATFFSVSEPIPAWIGPLADLLGSVDGVHRNETQQLGRSALLGDIALGLEQLGFVIAPRLAYPYIAQEHPVTEFGPVSAFSVDHSAVIDLLPTLTARADVELLRSPVRYLVLMRPDKGDYIANGGGWERAFDETCAIYAQVFSDAAIVDLMTRRIPLEGVLVVQWRESTRLRA